MADNKFGTGKLKQNLLRMHKELPSLLANDAKNYFSKSFTDQGWDGQKWKEVQRRIPGTNAYKYPKKKDKGRITRPILVGKGATKLRRAVANSIRIASWPWVVLIVGLPYARRHNEGLNGMPKRQFMGDSPILRAKQVKRIKNYIDKLWRG